MVSAWQASPGLQPPQGLGGAALAPTEPIAAPAQAETGLGLWPRGWVGAANGAPEGLVLKPPPFPGLQAPAGLLAPAPLCGASATGGGLLPDAGALPRDDFPTMSLALVGSPGLTNGFLGATTTPRRAASSGRCVGTTLGPPTAVVPYRRASVSPRRIPGGAVSPGRIGGVRHVPVPVQAISPSVCDSSLLPTQSLQSTVVDAVPPRDVVTVPSALLARIDGVVAEMERELSGEFAARQRNAGNELDRPMGHGRAHKGGHDWISQEIDLIESKREQCELRQAHLAKLRAIVSASKAVESGSDDPGSRTADSEEEGVGSRSTVLAGSEQDGSAPTQGGREADENEEPRLLRDGPRAERLEDEDDDAGSEQTCEDDGEMPTTARKMAPQQHGSTAEAGQRMVLLQAEGEKLKRRLEEQRVAHADLERQLEAVLRENEEFRKVVGDLEVECKRRLAELGHAATERAALEERCRRAEKQAERERENARRAVEGREGADTELAALEENSRAVLQDCRALQVRVRELEAERSALLAAAAAAASAGEAAAQGLPEGDAAAIAVAASAKQLSPLLEAERCLRAELLERDSALEVARESERRLAAELRELREEHERQIALRDGNEASARDVERHHAEQMERLQRRTGELERELADAKAAARALEASLQEQGSDRARVLELQREVAEALDSQEAQGRQVHEHRTRALELEDQLAEAQQTAESQAQQRNTLQTRLDELERRLELSQNLQSDVELHRQRSVELERDLDELRSELARESAQHSALKLKDAERDVQVSDAEAAAEQKERANKALLLARESLEEELLTERARADAQAKRAATLAAKLADVEQQLTESTAQVDLHRKQHASLKAQQSDLEVRVSHQSTLSTRCQQLELDLHEARSSKDSHGRQLEHSRSRVAELERTVVQLEESLSAQKSDARRAAAAQQARVEELEEELRGQSALRARLARLEAELEEAGKSQGCHEKKHASLQASLKEAQEHLVGEQAKILELETALSERARQVEEHESRARDLQGHLDKANEAHRLHQEKHDSLQNQHREREGQLRSSEARALELEERVRELEEELEESLSQSPRQLDAAAHAAAEAAARISELERSLRSAQERVADLETQHAEALENCSSLAVSQARVSQLEQELKKTEKDSVRERVVQRELKVAKQLEETAAERAAVSTASARRGSLVLAADIAATLAQATSSEERIVELEREVMELQKEIEVRHEGRSRRSSSITLPSDLLTEDSREDNNSELEEAKRLAEQYKAHHVSAQERIKELETQLQDAMEAQLQSQKSCHSSKRRASELEMRLEESLRGQTHQHQKHISDLESKLVSAEGEHVKALTSSEQRISRLAEELREARDAQESLFRERKEAQDSARRQVQTLELELEDERRAHRAAAARYSEELKAKDEAHASQTTQLRQQVELLQEQLRRAEAASKEWNAPEASGMSSLNARSSLSIHVGGAHLLREDLAGGGRGALAERLREAQGACREALRETREANSALVEAQLGAVAARGDRSVSTALQGEFPSKLQLLRVRSDRIAACETRLGVLRAFQRELPETRELSEAERGEVLERLALELEVDSEELGVIRAEPAGLASLPEDFVAALADIHTSGLDPDRHWSSGFTPMHWAAQNGRVDVLDYLLRQPGGVDMAVARDSHGRMPLYYAETSQRHAAVRHLRTAARSRDAAAAAGPPALAAAAGAARRPSTTASSLSGPYLQVLEQIETEGWHAVSWKRGFTMLHWAAGKGDTALCRYLVELDADVNAQDDSTKTPLTCAREAGHLETVEALRQLSKRSERTQALGAPLSPPRAQLALGGGIADNNDDETASSDASVASSSRPPSKGGGGGFPDGYLQVIKQIDQVGWANMQWARGFSLLHWAAKRDMPELCARFMFQGASPFHKDDTGRNSLDYAREHGSLNALSQLQRGAPATLPALPAHIVAAIRDSAVAGTAGAGSRQSLRPQVAGVRGASADAAAAATMWPRASLKPLQSPGELASE
eukprot:TRINITY_DN21177_c0_g8_i1.p1 TRINITY_DN21177_c0_g8~~TRINITY_DN21177_c0_g8_i1.p1  ORF type:complete len:2039 (+),score=538.32 TRINITY_DN21177_c0_g8_i1:109-6117(+)